jgi:putative serine protease PepD
VGAADARTPGAAADGPAPTAAADTEAFGSEVRDGGTGGDFELERPAVGAAPRAAGADTGGDFELERPAPAHQLSAPGGGSDGGPSDVVPADAFRAEAVSVGEGVADAGAATDAASSATAPTGRVPADRVPADRLGAGDVSPQVAVDAGAALGRGAATDLGDRPKPLHDPDPYGTPPYGQPGPWAPAPPVQHPAATPAHGTHVPAGTPTLGTTLPPTPVQGPSVPPPTAQGPSLPTPPAQGMSAPPTPVGHGAHIPPAPAPAPYPGTPHDAPMRPAPAPWQNYDPWAAAPGPLQQNGAAVVSVAQRRKRVKKGLVLGAVVIALVSGGVGGAVGAYLERNGGIGDVELSQAGKEAPGRAPDSVAGIAAHALPSVVTLHVRGSQEEGTGTGFVLDSRGHILTNNHVIEPAGSDGEISVTFSGGETAKAEVVGHDSGYDLAVVKVSGVSGLEPMPLGNSDNVQVGDPVVAIGAPFDLANTVTSGIISAKERPITAGGEKGDGTDVSYVDALQTDAPINPGNSGGPLLDSKARVIGINSAIRSADSGSGLESGQAGSIGLGFAIPINQGKRVAEELINTGKATHPVIGVTLDMNYTGDGARVGTKGNNGGPAVIAGGPGADAGIKAGDIITEVDGRRVHSGEELIVKTRAHRPGDRLRLTLKRGGEEQQVTLVLGSADGD